MSNKSVELEKLAGGDEASIGRAGYYKDADYIDENAYGYGPVQGEGVQLANIWRAVRKRKWLIAAITALVTLLVTVEVHRPKPIYEASATVEVKKDTWVMIKSGDTLLEEEADTALSLPTIKTNTLMLKSRPLLQDVVSRLKLTREPAFFDITRKKRSILETLQSLSPMTGSQQQVDEQGSTHPEPDEVESAESVETADNPEQQESEMSEEERALLRSYVRVLQDNLSVEPVKDTRVLRVSFTHTDPHIAAAVANGVAESFIDRRFNNSTTRLNRATAWLRRTTTDLKSKVERAELTLSQYSREHNIYAPEAKATLTSDKLTKLHSEALRAETERVLKESLHEEVKAGRIEQLPEAFADPRSAALQVELGQLAIQEAQLSVSFGPKNPQVAEVRQKMDAIRQQIEKSRTALEQKLKAEYARAARDEKTLKGALEQAKSEAVEENQYAIQYNLLKQEADTARSLYTQFLQKTNQANIQLAEQPSNARLIEPADIPSYPLTPNRPLYILFAFLISFVGCAGAAFAFERLNKNIKSLEDVTRYVQLPAIGIIPQIKAQSSRQLLARNGNGKNGRAGDERLSGSFRPASFSTVVSTDDRSVAAEAYRAVSTSVLLAPQDSPPKTLLVTSGLPGEGKTTTVINTAISLAQFGASVLIIDCDLRNPTTHKIFNVESGRGLSTYLSSDVGIDELVHKLEVPNLHWLPAGPIPQNPAKLIISPKMKALLKTLGERYDHILIDSPPLVGVTDPIILSTLVDGVIVVVHGTKSTRERARRTRHELSIVGANIFGVVLNNISFTDYQYYEPDYKYLGSKKEDS
jgi:capsular exopolysaccharide synthesis family protein